MRSTDDADEHPKRFKVPRRSKRQASKPFFFCDNAQYVLGRVASDKKDANLPRVRQCFDRFRSLVAECARTSHDVGAQAMNAFLTRVGEDPDSFSLPEKLKSNDAIAFVLDSDMATLITDRPAVEAHWREMRKPDESVAQITCLVSGRRAAPSGVHPSIKKLPGPKPETALISFNKPAFWSYGWAQHRERYSLQGRF